VTLLVTDQTVVRTRLGEVRGTVTAGIHVFKGVPYAAPPFGARRFLPPVPASPWPGVRHAVEWGPEPPQPRPPADGPVAGMVWDPATPGEDCLNLNVWTPDPTATGLPVMVWIPGGMFEVGTGATYDGSRFARDGVVCVTINYRVGPEGFMYLADGHPNLGLQDQIAALEWVRDNIAAFGGDAQTVTIFGESAGAMSVGTLLAVPRAEGLFRRAICQSGAADRVIPAASALRMGVFLAERLGVAATREAMATVTPDAMLAAAAGLKADLLSDPDPVRWDSEVVASMLPWQPVVDGMFLPAPPIERIASGASAAVDVMIGSNVDDWRLFVVVNGSFERVTDEVLAGPIDRYAFESAAAYGITGAALAAYRDRYPAAAPAELLSFIETDWWCRIPAIRLAEAHAPAGALTFMYEFEWASPVFGGMFGACHALELPFVFDTLDLGPRQMMGGLLGDAPPQALADAMHRGWVAFAATGDPGWPRYDRERRATMRFDTVSRVVDDPRSFERDLWGGRSGA
jgi:para-nitrobenzyl esterase